MAIAKPVRLLAAACMVLFFFLALQMIRSPQMVKMPGPESRFSDMVRDPNLDGMAHERALDRLTRSDTGSSDRRAS